MQEYMHSVGRDINFKKNQKGVLEVNDIVTEMKNAMVFISSSVN